MGLTERVRRIYGWIEAQQKQFPQKAGDCHTCGKCCNFKAYDHRLYVTPVEIEYLIQNIGAENIKQFRDGVCPYNDNGRCGVYDYRFAGCRIFCCQGDKDFQSRLSESALKELKKLCADFNLPYQYSELSKSLKGLAS